jgi:hypothetical protein
MLFGLAHYILDDGQMKLATNGGLKKRKIMQINRCATSRIWQKEGGSFGGGEKLSSGRSLL